MDIECREGWLPLIADLQQTLDALVAAGNPPVEIVRARQKFGKLQISAKGCNAVTRAAIRAAQDRSLSICERCGAEGELLEADGFEVVCAVHRPSWAHPLPPATEAAIRRR